MERITFFLVLGLVRTLWPGQRDECRDVPMQPGVHLAMVIPDSLARRSNT